MVEPKRPPVVPVAAGAGAGAGAVPVPVPAPVPALAPNENAGLFCWAPKRPPPVLVLVPSVEGCEEPKRPVLGAAGLAPKRPVPLWAG